MKSEIKANKGRIKLGKMLITIGCHKNNIKTTISWFRVEEILDFNYNGRIKKENKVSSENAIQNICRRFRHSLPLVYRFVNKSQQCGKTGLITRGWQTNFLWRKFCLSSLVTFARFRHNLFSLSNLFFILGAFFILSSPWMSKGVHLHRFLHCSLRMLLQNART